MITKEELATLLDMELSTTIAKTETLTAKLSEFPLSAIAAFLAYGFQRKFNDAVGGKEQSEGVPYTPELKIADAKALMDDFRQGKITKRGLGGSPVTDETRAGRKVMRAILPDKLSAPDLKAFRALEPDEQNTKLDAWVAANSEALAKAIATEVKEMAAARARKASLATSITVTI